jgi:hypothetical protein
MFTAPVGQPSSYLRFFICQQLYRVFLLPSADMFVQYADQYNHISLTLVLIMWYIVVFFLLYSLRPRSTPNCT